MHECTRCGLSCLSGICGQGIEDEKKGCKHLSFNRNGIASCQLVVDNKYNPRHIAIGAGCVLKHIPSVYKTYKDLYANWKRDLCRASN